MKTNRAGVATLRVKLVDIERDTSIQCRAEINAGTVAEYQQQMVEKKKFPAAILFEDKGRYWIGDGWHRIAAAEEVGYVDMEAEVRPGGRGEALRFALGANQQHGLRRSNADKRRCVEIALREFPQESSRQLADMCGVGKDLVEDVRQVAESATSTRVGKDGKSYPVKRAGTPYDAAVTPANEDSTADKPAGMGSRPSALEESPPPSKAGEGHETPTPLAGAEAAPEGESKAGETGSTAMGLARRAVACLAQIPECAPDRFAALALVVTWLSEHMRPRKAA